MPSALTDVEVTPDASGFNLARLKCLTLLIEGLLVSQTVNLASVASGLRGSAQIESHYMRLQHFMKEVAFDYGPLARLLAEVMGWTVILDRTNWQFGKAHINILYLAVAWKSVAIPLF